MLEDQYAESIIKSLDLIKEAVYTSEVKLENVPEFNDEFEGIVTGEA